MNAQAPTQCELAAPTAQSDAHRADTLYLQVAREFGAPLARLAAGYEANKERQKDLLQDIHVALWRSLSSFKGQCSLRTWVYRIAHNTASSHVLKQTRWRASKWISIEEMDDIPSQSDYSSQLDEGAALTKLLRLIHQLKTIDRDVILLYLEDIEAKEIGDIVGLSSTNVAQKIHRIKTLLRRQFEHGADHVDSP